MTSFFLSILSDRLSKYATAKVHSKDMTQKAAPGGKTLHYMCASIVQ